MWKREPLFTLLSFSSVDSCLLILACLVTVVLRLFQEAGVSVRRCTSQRRVVVGLVWLKQGLGSVVPKASFAVLALVALRSSHIHTFLASSLLCFIDVYLFAYHVVRFLVDKLCPTSLWVRVR